MTKQQVLKGINKKLQHCGYLQVEKNATLQEGEFSMQNDYEVHIMVRGHLMILDALTYLDKLCILYHDVYNIYIEYAAITQVRRSLNGLQLIGNFGAITIPNEGY